jgi:hypothetical protein
VRRFAGTKFNEFDAIGKLLEHLPPHPRRCWETPVSTAVSTVGNPRTPLDGAHAAKCVIEFYAKILWSTVGNS